MTLARKELGKHGEELAAEFLLEKGYEILARNLTVRLGEIDILARYDGTIVIVEVKAQAKGELIDPIYKVNPAKQRKLSLLARLISARYPNSNIRLDAITLYWKPGSDLPIITHYENIL